MENDDVEAMMEELVEELCSGGRCRSRGVDKVAMAGLAGGSGQTERRGQSVADRGTSTLGVSG